MWLQHSSEIYYRKNDGSIYGVNAPIGQSRSDGTYVLPDSGCPQQSLFFSLSVVLIIQGPSVYVVDCSSNTSCWGMWAMTMGGFSTFGHRADILF